MIFSPGQLQFELQFRSYQKLLEDFLSKLCWHQRPLEDLHLCLTLHRSIAQLIEK